VQEAPEGNTAGILGLNTAAVDGTTLILQLPPVLPALTLQEAASRRTVSAHASIEAGKPIAANLSGPEVLHALPKGKVHLFIICLFLVLT
jgi:hypothetical protein